MKAFYVFAARLIGVLGATLALGACSSFTTTTDGVSSSIHSVSEATSSTTDGDESESSKTAYVNSRIDAIRSDAAKGGGESVDTLARLLGETDRGEFARWMKDNYSRLFTGLRAPGELLHRIEKYRTTG